MSDMICRKTMTRCQTQGMCSPHGGCGPAEERRIAVSGELSFSLDGIGFSGMPLERVAQYMSALSGLVGDTAIFVRMTSNSIVFLDAGAQNTHKAAETLAEQGVDGGAQ